MGVAVYFLMSLRDSCHEFFEETVHKTLISE